MASYKRGEDTETKGEEGDATMEADWSDVVTRQGAPRTAGSHQKLRERRGTDSPSEPPEGTHPTDTLISDFWPPEL